jgi:hypothetical protein
MMHESLMGALILGHLMGDYLFQNDWMALNKSKPGKQGLKACVTHCLIYTFFVLMILETASGTMLEIEIKKEVITAVVLFASHFFIDRYEIGNWWMTHVKGTGIRQILDTGKSIDLGGETFTRKAVIQMAFSSYVYIVTDNTMHLVLMWFGLRLVGW